MNCKITTTHVILSSLPATRFSLSFSLPNRLKRRGAFANRLLPLKPTSPLDLSVTHPSPRSISLQLRSICHLRLSIPFSRNSVRSRIIHMVSIQSENGVEGDDEEEKEEEEEEEEDEDEPRLKYLRVGGNVPSQIVVRCCVGSGSILRFSWQVYNWLLWCDLSFGDDLICCSWFVCSSSFSYGYGMLAIVVPTRCMMYFHYGFHLSWFDFHYGCHDLVDKNGVL